MRSIFKVVETENREKCKKIKKLYYIPKDRYEEEGINKSTIVGVTTLKKINNKSVASLLHNRDMYECIPWHEDNATYEAALGAIKIGEGKYVLISYKKKHLPIILLLTSLLVAAIVTFYFLNKEPADKIAYSSDNEVEIIGDADDIVSPGIANVESGDDINLPTPMTNVSYNKYKGFSSVYISKDSSIIPWVNDKSNENYAYFQLYDKQRNEVYHTEGVIPPGKHVDWDAYNLVNKPGTYVYDLVITFYKLTYNSFDEVKMVPCGMNAVVKDFTIYVVE